MSKSGATTQDTAVQEVHRRASEYHDNGVADANNSASDREHSNEAHESTAEPRAINGPALFHKVKNRKSILAIVISKSRVFAGTQGGDLLVWSLETYELLYSIAAHRGAVLGLFVSHDGKLLFSSAGDAIVNVWCTQKLTRLYHIWSTYDVGDVFCVAYSTDLQTVYLGAQNTSIQWLNLSGNTSCASPNLGSHPLNRQNKFFDSTGPGGVPTTRSVLGAEILAQGGQVIEIDKKHIIQYAHFGYVYCMVLARGNIHREPGEETLITGGGDGTIKMWGLTENGKPSVIRCIETMENGDNSILSMALDGTFLYAGRLEGDVDVWDLDTRQLIRTVNAHTADVLTITVGQDLIFTGGSNGWAKIFDRRYRCTNQWKAHDRLILASSITSYNNKAVLVTGGNDDCVAIWDVGANVSQSNMNLRNTNEELLESLRKLVSFCTVSSKEEYAEECRRGASWLRNLFKRFGASTEMLNTDDNKNPIIFARFRGKNSGGDNENRILFYGHYDVIDAENKQKKWKTDPFEMQGIDGYLYGRGTSDNKGPVLAALYAVADLVAEKKLASDVTFLIEGEEENGSRGFKEAIRRNKHIIGDVDWILLANSYWLDDDIPCLTYGLRGVIHATVEVESKHPDLHSGVEGSHMMDEALKDLVMLLAKLTGPNGYVRIPGFYDTILPISQAENERYEAISRSLLCRYPEVADSDELIASFKAKWREPSFTMHGIKTSGPANSTIIPHNARAAVSLRLVPGQDALQIQQAFVAFLKDQFATLNTLNGLTIRINHQADPWLGDPKNQIFKMLEKAIMEVWGSVGPTRRGSIVVSKSPVDIMTNGLASPKLSPVTFSTRFNDGSPKAHAIGGAVWHGVKGFRNSPYGERRIGALTAIKARAPVLGGNFGVWGGLFSTFDCAVKGVRKKEDPYNAIIAGFFTGGALAVRGGLRAARNSAIACGCLLAVIEGVGIGFQRMMAENTRLDVPQPPPPPPPVEAAQTAMLA
ncbi:hypothetical protein MMC18_000417 [Xylographa bjoerkii]|nr:hypothetical protein [Xylographa bjoerkii]